MAPDSTCIREIGNKFLDGYVRVDDIYGQPAVVLRADVPRAAYAQGQRSQIYFAVALVIIVLFFALFTDWLLAKSVSSRLEALNSQRGDDCGE